MWLGLFMSTDSEMSDKKILFVRRLTKFLTPV